MYYLCVCNVHALVCLLHVCLILIINVKLNNQNLLMLMKMVLNQ